MALEKGGKRVLKKKLLVALLLLVMTSFLSVFSEEKETEKIVVTELNIEIADEREILEIVLNDKIQIREIERGEFAGRTIVKFPAFISSRGTVYPCVEVLKEELQKEIIRAVESGEPSNENLDELRWEITKLVEFRGHSRRGAHFSVTFNDALRINDRVIERDDGTVWVAWPARPPREGESRWQQQVRILDRGLRQDIEKALIESYELLTEDR